MTKRGWARPTRGIGATLLAVCALMVPGTTAASATEVPTPSPTASTAAEPTPEPSATAPIDPSPTAVPPSTGAAVTGAGPGTEDVVAPETLPTDDTVSASSARSGRLAVGDSLLVGARSLMHHYGFAIHARVGRQFSTAPGIVRSYGRRLPRNVVIELGTNGTVSLTTCRSVVRAAGPSRRVFLVTNRVPRSWQDSNNATLRACDRSFAASRVRIVDWYRASAGHSGWFAADSIHTSSIGRRAFARLIDRAVDRHGR